MNKSKKPTKETKDAVRYRRQRNLVAKNNKHRSAFHTSKKWTRTSKYNERYFDQDEQQEINDWWERTV